MVLDIATPKALPKDDAILYNPDATPTLSSGASATAVSVEGVAYVPKPIPNNK